MIIICLFNLIKDHLLGLQYLTFLVVNNIKAKFLKMCVAREVSYSRSDDGYRSL